MKVRYVDVDYISYRNLTPGKVYDVIKNIKGYKLNQDKVSIINDKGIEKLYYVYSSDGKRTILEDVTEEYRNEVIDDILL